MKIKIVTATIATAMSLTMSYSQTQKLNKMKPYKISIAQEQIVQLNDRISTTRWITETENVGWNPSLTVNFFKEVAQYWTNSFDWKKQEAYINGFQQYTVQVNDINIHFVYEKGADSKSIPILLLHGWAGNFNEFLKVTSLLKKENSNLDIIVPSIPGFGFSGNPSSMSSDNIAEYIHQLMTDVLGYTSYYVHGGDYGAFIGEKLALKYPESVKGLHLSDIPFYHLYGVNEDLSESEKEFIQKINNWSMTDGAYAMIQGTKPKILSTGLNDSPMALAAWLLQLHHDFGNKEKDIFERFNKDELITNICIYWFNDKIYSSMRMYSEDMSGYEETPASKVTVPTGFGFNAYDISGIPPKEFADRFFETIVSWSEHAEAGHFSALSHPEQLKIELMKFVQTVESGK